MTAHPCAEEHPLSLADFPTSLLAVWASDCTTRDPFAVVDRISLIKAGRRELDGSSWALVEPVRESCPVCHDDPQSVERYANGRMVETVPADCPRCGARNPLAHIGWAS
jgi:hypothetical protein